MNLIGQRVRLLSARDPTKKGISGNVVLETAKTFLLEAGPRTLMVEKSGSVFQLLSGGAVIVGDDVVGRLEDRWGGRSR